MTEHADLVEFSDYVWTRLRDRLDGLTDDEYRWDPGVTTLAWRMTHLRDMLAEERNATWLGQPPDAVPCGEPDSAEAAMAGLRAAYGSWRSALVACEDVTGPIGAVAGHYGAATRRSFVHHVLDELIHHGAEVALLRDLYSAR
jgi:hypothetical protein